ncbi:MAG: hypothetical protein ACRDPT_08800 [Streptomycetales bacterium]
MKHEPYRVVVTRDEGAWLADVPELEGTHTWARNLPALDRYVREVIVLAADLSDGAMGDLQLDYEYSTGDKTLDAETAALRALRAELAAAERRTEGMVRKLRDRGFSVRDTAVLTGISYQRVSQLRPTQRDDPREVA